MYYSDIQPIPIDRQGLIIFLFVWSCQALQILPEKIARGIVVGAFEKTRSNSLAASLSYESHDAATCLIFAISILSMIRSSKMRLLPAQASVMLVLQVRLPQTTIDLVACLLASHESIKRTPIFQLSFKRLDSFSSVRLGKRAQERACCRDTNHAASTSPTCVGQGRRVVF